jgi:low temperature requirement protein LtrA
MAAPPTAASGSVAVEAAAAGAEPRVTPLELFFDLVFVFAITQVTGFLAAEPSWARLVQGLAIMAVLWWAWESYVWLGNTAASDEGLVRVVMLSAMAAMAVVSLAVPSAFGDEALVFGVAYLAVRLLHLAMYAVVSRDDPTLRAVIVRLAASALPAAALLTLAGVLEGSARDACWILALAVDYGGLAVGGVEGWRVAAGHFAERHGLIIIIALGESIVSVGVGAGGLPLDAGLVTAALLGMVVAGVLWWAYFDVVALVAERRLRAAEPLARVRMARDSYTYLHLPMTAGIVLFAFGVKKTLAHVGDDLDGVAAAGLCSGVALYLLALSAFKRRNVGSFNSPRLCAAAALGAVGVAATELPALASLALVALVGVTLIAYEVVRYAEARDRIRHGG